MSTCSSCNAELDASATTCPACGAQSAADGFNLDMSFLDDIDVPGTEDLPAVAPDQPSAEPQEDFDPSSIFADLDLELQEEDEKAKKASGSGRNPRHPPMVSSGPSRYKPELVTAKPKTDSGVRRFGGTNTGGMVDFADDVVDDATVAVNPAQLAQLTTDRDGTPPSPLPPKTGDATFDMAARGAPVDDDDATPGVDDRPSVPFGLSAVAVPDLSSGPVENLGATRNIRPQTQPGGEVMDPPPPAASGGQSVETEKKGNNALLWVLLVLLLAAGGAVAYFLLQ